MMSIMLNLWSRYSYGLKLKKPPGIDHGVTAITSAIVQRNKSNRLLSYCSYASLLKGTITTVL